MGGWISFWITVSRRVGDVSIVACIVYQVVSLIYIAGFELYTDLILADFLLRTPCVSEVVFQ